MSSIVDLLPLLALAIKNEHVVNAERYISGELARRFALLSLLGALTCPTAVALALFMYDYTLTFGDELQYIWRRPVTGIKILYLILRYGVAFAVLVYFQGETCLRVCALNSTFIWHMIYSTKWVGNSSVTQCVYPAYSYASKLSPNCSQLSVILAVCDTEMLTFLASCVGSLIVVAVVGSMALALANCKSVV